jgi:hypothetical protein
MEKKKIKEDIDWESIIEDEIKDMILNFGYDDDAELMI